MSYYAATIARPVGPLMLADLVIQLGYPRLTLPPPHPLVNGCMS